MGYADRYQAVIGLELHAELLTDSKMFTGAPVVDSVTAPPNTAVLPLCLGMPGTLPVINQRAVEYALRVALALNCQINRFNRFARKNYFYPDLPKGYQISQYEEPIGVNGYLDVLMEDGSTQRIRVRRVHMEEDTGKLTHLPDGTSLVDYNRAGVPLLEIVTEPDIHSAEAAYAYATQLRQILRYLGVNSGDLEKGVLRVEPNISLRPHGTTRLGTRTEVKNLNSFRALLQATEFELERQAALLDAGRSIVQETRGWDEDRRQTFAQRAKEEAHDYRYFPDPDLPPLELDPAWIAEVAAQLPELPAAKIARYRHDDGLTLYEARLLAEERPTALWFEAAVRAGGAPKAVSNLLLNNLFKLINDSGQTIDAIAVTPDALAALLALVEADTINNNIAKQVLETMFATGEAPAAVVQRLGLAQVSDGDAILAVVRQVLADNPAELEAYRAGKHKLRGFFVGQVMRTLRGKGNPAIINQLLDAELERA